MVGDKVGSEGVKWLVHSFWSYLDAGLSLKFKVGEYKIQQVGSESNS